MRQLSTAEKHFPPGIVSTDRGTKTPADDLNVGDALVPRLSCVLLVICLIAGPSFVCLFETSPAIAKQKSTVVKTDRKFNIVKKNKSVTDRNKKQKSFPAKRRKSIVSAEEEAHTILEVRTPVDKHDCIAAAQVFYVRAQSLARRTKQTIPQEFQRVVFKLDELCGEEEFDKARLSIDWMSRCLENLGKDNKVCSRNESHLCAIDPLSKACIASGARASD